MFTRRGIGIQRQHVDSFLANVLLHRPQWEVYWTEPFVTPVKNKDFLKGLAAIKVVERRMAVLYRAFPRDRTYEGVIDWQRDYDVGIQGLK